MEYTSRYSVFLITTSRSRNVSVQTELFNTKEVCTFVPFPFREYNEVHLEMNDPLTSSVQASTREHHEPDQRSSLAPASRDPSG